MVTLSRRELLRAGMYGSGVMALGAVSGCAPEWTPPSNGTPFTLGVMSGLHSPDAVVLWTRLDPLVAGGSAEVRWSLATDPSMSTVIRSGVAVADPAHDSTVKLLVEGLDPDRSYWFRFDIDEGASVIGRARTVPDPGAAATSLRLAVGSCQNWAAGWYHAWKGIAEENVDAVLWLGDYIYESAGSQIGARKDTSGSADTLETYWSKYRYYRSDPNLQAGHAAHPFVPVWDDHEFVNDFNRHTLVESPQRWTAAYQAWFDYMPVWPIDGTQIYRSFRWGDLAEIVMLDERQYRDNQANGFQGLGPKSILGTGEIIREAWQPGRSILGATQRDWLLDTVGSAHDDGVRWKLLGNQVMMTPTRALDFDNATLRALNPGMVDGDGLFINMDSWNSYLWERQQLFDRWWADGVDGLAVLTGDIHCFWKSRQRLDIDDPNSPVIAGEYVIGSISSTGPGLLGIDDLGTWMEQGPIAWNPAFDYADFKNNGYGLVEATPDRLDVRFRTTRAPERYYGVHNGPLFTQTF